jgi:putative transposase
VSEAKRLRSLEDENGKLRKLLAEAMLNVPVLSFRQRGGVEGHRGKKVVTPGAKREAVAHAQSAFGLSERRACGIIGVSRHGNSYASWRPDNGVLRERLRDLASERRRFCYRRLGYLQARERITPDHKKLLRIYRKEGLKVRRRNGRKRALWTRAPMTVPQGPNQRWSLDPSTTLQALRTCFVSDASQD